MEGCGKNRIVIIGALYHRPFGHLCDQEDGSRSIGDWGPWNENGAGSMVEYDCDAGTELSTAGRGQGLRTNLGRACRALAR